MRECAVLGVADAKRGELVAAAVVASDPSLDESRLRAWWSDRLVHYQQPKLVFFVDALTAKQHGQGAATQLREKAPKAKG